MHRGPWVQRVENSPSAVGSIRLFERRAPTLHDAPAEPLCSRNSPRHQIPCGVLFCMSNMQPG